MIARTLSVFFLFVASCLAQAPVHPFNAVCDISVSYGNMSNGGSGTLISVDRNTNQAIVATCGHLWERSGQAQDIAVIFPHGAYRAQVLKHSFALDLALLVISAPPEDIKPVAIGDWTQKSIIGGYGQNQLLFQMGITDKTYTNQEKTAVYRQIRGAEAKSGDSGGPVFNEHGEFVTVLWGASEGDTMASGQEQFIKFCAEWVSKGVNERQQRCINGSCPQPGFGSSQGWSSVPRSPSRRTVVPYNRPLPSRPGSIAVPVQPKKPTQACNCKSRLSALEADVKGLKESGGTTGAIGPQGPPGPPGTDGKDGSVDPEAIANLVLASLDARLTSIENRLEANNVQEPGEGVIYYRIVANESADYWKRISSYYEKASEAYSQIKVVPQPDFPVGQMPQMVAYEGGKPLGAFKGSYEVENALASISRGSVPLPTK